MYLFQKKHQFSRGFLKNALENEVRQSEQEPHRHNRYRHIKLEIYRIAILVLPGGNIPKKKFFINFRRVFS